MNDQRIITREFFARRLADLCLRSGMSGLPKDDTSRHLLFTSMVSNLPADAPLDEKDVNVELTRWIATSQIAGLDHVTLRRQLVDAGYLLRRGDGSEYRVAPSPPGQPAFEDDAARQDLRVVLDARREEIARRKADFLAKSRA